MLVSFYGQGHTFLSTKFNHAIEIESNFNRTIEQLTQQQQDILVNI